MNAKHILLSALTAFAALSLSASENNVKVVAHMGYWRAPGSAQNSIDAMVQASAVLTTVYGFSSAIPSGFSNSTTSA